MADYRNAIAKELEQNEYDEQLYNIKSTLYSKLVSDTEVIQYPDKEVKKQIKELEETYKNMAKNSNVDWEDYLTDTLGVTQEQFDEQVELYAKELVKQEMI